MQVVILAAGSSSRFYPFNVTHKACLSLLGKTIIEHTIASVKKAGYTDIVLVISPSDTIRTILGDGSQMGVNITYVIQEEATGAGDALLLAREAIHDDFFVIWGSRVEFDQFAPELVNAKKEKDQGAILIKETENIAGVGVVTVEDNRLTDIIEKPDTQNPPSHLKIVGVYLLPQLFLQTLAQTPVAHYSFEDALVSFGKQHAVIAVETTKETLTLKYPWDILTVKNYLLRNMADFRSPDAVIAKTALLEGTVSVSEGAKIMENAVIKGPCFIGKNAFIGNNALLRGGVVVEEGVVVGTNMELKNAVILKHSTTHSGFIGDSVIGESCKIAANFCTGNVRLDRQPVQVRVGEKEVNSHQKSLGVFMGNETKAGISVSTMPGTIIGKNVIIGPQTAVMKHIPDDTKYYTKFQEIVEKNI